MPRTIAPSPTVNLNECVSKASWRDNLKLFLSDSPKIKCADNAFSVSIVDEAHALIDPTVADRKGMAASGWMLHAGPQAWHVIRSSRVATRVQALLKSRLKLDQLTLSPMTSDDVRRPARHVVEHL